MSTRVQFPPDYTGKADKPELAKQFVGNDPWVHRSLGMRCRTCMYFVEKIPSEPRAFDPATCLGRCRRHAPLANAGGWPAVYANDWCGDHKIDENKV